MGNNPSLVFDKPGRVFLGGANVFRDQGSWFHDASAADSKQQGDDDTEEQDEDEEVEVEDPDFTKGEITHIVSMCKLSPRLKPDMRIRRLEHLHCPVDDEKGQDLTSFFVNVSLFIHCARCSKRPDGEPCAVYVHCVAGVSRSSTVLCAYVMAWLKCSQAEALKFLACRREVINPNEGFRLQLTAWEASLERSSLHAQLLDASRFNVSPDWMQQLHAQDLHTVRSTCASGDKVQTPPDDTPTLTPQQKLQQKRERGERHRRKEKAAL